MKARDEKSLGCHFNYYRGITTYTLYLCVFINKSVKDGKLTKRIRICKYSPQNRIKTCE